MEARELAEAVKDDLGRGDCTSPLVFVETRWGYGESDFFVETDGEGTFLVSVVKVSE